MKKLLSLLCILLLACTAWAYDWWTDPETGIEWGYEIRNGTVSIEGEYYGAPSIPLTTTGPLTVPTHVKGIPVTAVGNVAFHSCSGLTSVTIPEGVTSIGAQAFENCSGLTSVSIPAGTTRIGDNAFDGCPKLPVIDGVRYESCAKTVLIAAPKDCSGAFVIPSGVRFIYQGAFSECSGMTSVEMPEGLLSIGYGAFYKCSGLTSVTLPAGLTSIRERAFSDCSGLTSMEIPEGVTALRGGVFSGCSRLTSVKIPEGVTSVGGRAFEGCSSLTSVTLPEGVTTLGDYVFCDCSRLTSVKLPKGITAIGVWAFCGCSGLTSVTVPEGVTSIGIRAFGDCSSLSSVELPESVTAIGTYVFQNCVSLTSVTLPKRITAISRGMFYGCTGLTAIPVREGVTTIGDGAFFGCTGLTALTIPKSVTTIEIGAFSGVAPKTLIAPCVPVAMSMKNLTTVTLLEGVTSVEKNTFSSCKNLTSVTLPPGVTAIGERAFYWCRRLKTVTLCEGVTSIGPYAFEGCKELSPLTIPASVNTIGDFAFAGCNGVSVAPNNPYYSSDAYGVLFDKSGSLLIRAPHGLSSYAVPEGVTTIGSCAFEDCSDLTSAKIPASVCVIRDSAFLGCNGVSVAPDNRHYSADAFGVLFDKAGSHLIQAPRKLGAYTVPEGVTSIEWNAFRDCAGLTAVSIPKSVTSIGMYAFMNCTGLSSADIPEGVTELGYGAFRGCTGLTAVSIPKSVTSIGMYAFMNCTGLSSADIPEGVTELEYGTFRGCTGLTAVTLPESLAAVGQRAFEGCDKAVFSIQGAPMQTVGSNAFPAGRPGCYTTKHAEAWRAVLGGPLGEWHGLSMAQKIVTPGDIPVITAPGGPALSKEDTAAIKHLLGNDLAKAFESGLVSVKVHGSAEAVGAALDLGIAPETAVSGSELTATFRLPTLEVLRFEPASGTLRVRVVPAANTEIRQQPVAAAIRAVGAVSPDGPMTDISVTDLNLTPYLGQGTDGEFDVTADIKHTPFIRIEAGSPRKVRQASDAK